MNLLPIKQEQIYAVGDIHGRFMEDVYPFLKFGVISDCAIIVCGDVGMGFDSDEYYEVTFKKLSKILDEKNIDLYMFRGNHDDPSYFDGSYFNEFERIHLIPDYTVLQCPSHNILCVGGATSIDRTMRIKKMEQRIGVYMRFHDCDDINVAKENIKKTYWENEAAVYDEEKLNEIKSNGVSIDVVCTHTCPSFCDPITKDGCSGWFLYDDKLEDDLTDERHTMDELKNKLSEDGHPLRLWLYGHFHRHNEEIIGGVRYVMLNMSYNQTLDLSAIER